MTNQNPRPSRRSVLKLLGTIAAIPSASTILGTDPTPDAVVLKSADVPPKYDPITIDFEQASFFSALSEVTEETADPEFASRGFLHTEDGELLGGIGSVAISYDQSPPKYQTLTQVMTRCFDSFADGFGRDATTTVTRQPDKRALEWNIEVADPDWELDAAYADVTHLQLVSGTVIGTVAYGPTTPGASPTDRAREYSSLTRTRALRDTVVESRRGEAQ